MKKFIPKLLGWYINTMNRLWPAVGAKHGFWLFCYPMKAKLSEKQQAYLATAERQDILVQGNKVPLYRWGNGKKTCLFVHGWQSNTYRWKLYIDALDKSEWTIYSIDAPGHGNANSKFANVPLFVAAIEEANKTIPSIDAMIGHSVGAFSLLYFGHLHPEEQPEKLVILGSPGRAMDFVDHFASIIGLAPHARKNMINYFIKYTGHDPDYFMVKNFVPSITSEGLIIHDEGDKDAPPHYAHEIHKGWPTSTLWMTKGWGHKLRNPAVVNRVIKFLSTSTA